MADWITKTSVDCGQLYAPDATQDVAMNFLIHLQEFDGKNKTFSTRRNSRQLTAYTFSQKQNSWFIYRFKYSFHFRRWNKTLGAKIQKVQFDCAFLFAYSCSVKEPHKAKNQKSPGKYRPASVPVVANNIATPCGRLI